LIRAVIHFREIGSMRNSKKFAQISLIGRGLIEIGLTQTGLIERSLVLIAQKHLIENPLIYIYGERELQFK
jgi:hypothetical protein